MNVEPEQDAVPHDTEVAASAQAPAPLQAPVLPQGAAAGHWPVGAVVPAASGVQVPGAVPLQVWQVPQVVVLVWLQVPVPEQDDGGW